ncbi:hypothetical protein [Candidatus Odyssella thessalonicensis]|uniref:hypothetical protein n=1 Tax=Candidatus Odyssella thessalonicensis TaxID=84647 RepID=UPI000225A93B|nr:hypothetical protein [Candidatus Odyssella thessalonicensis]
MKILSAFIKLFLIIFETSAMGAEKVPAQIAWASLNSYLDAMTHQNKKAILIIGCSHEDSATATEDHRHLDAWCVNIKDPEPYIPHYYKLGTTYTPLDKQQQQQRWDFLKANDELDITHSHLYPLSSYRGKFDIVLLERNWETTLSNVWTLFNAASFLKPGGELVIDIHSSYRFSAYENYDNSYRAALGKPYNLHLTSGHSYAARRKEIPQELDNQIALNRDFLFNFYGKSYQEFRGEADQIPSEWDPQLLHDSIIEKYKQYNKTYTASNNSRSIAPAVPQLKGVADYLICWFFKDPILIKGGILSYNSRQTDYLIIIKTQATQDHERAWKSEIQRYLKENKSSKGN